MNARTELEGISADTRPYASLPLLCKPSMIALFMLLVLGTGIPATVVADATRFGADWPQFRGPQRNGVSPESGWSYQWPEGGPKRLWSVELGDCYASPIVANGRVYAQGSTAEKDTFYCLNAETGDKIWTRSLSHAPRSYPPDPRPHALTATPLFQNNRLYVLQREGILLCLDAKNGEVVWQVNLIKESGATLQQFGAASSPVLENNLLLFNMGTGGIAVEKNTGKVVWKSTGTGGYASPVLYTRNGKREAALYGELTIVGVEAATGKEIWRFPWKAKPFGAPAADPLLYGDRLLACSSMEGCKLLQLGAASPTVIWQNTNLATDFTNSVLLGRFVYGNCRNKLTCLDIVTGETKWQEPGLGQGALIAADGKLILLTERGELIVAEASPGKYRELAKTKLFEGNGFFGSAGFIAPTLANGLLYCRTSTGPLVCLSLRGK